jgi:hypothetical protein
MLNVLTTSVVVLMALPSNIRAARKNLPVTNTAAYFAAASVTDEKKSFMTLTPVVNVIKLFSSSLMMRNNKLEHLSWESDYQYKHSSLFGLIDSDEGKMFYDVDTRSIRTESCRH